MSKPKASVALGRPASGLYAQLLSQLVTRSEFVIGKETADAWRGALRNRNYNRVIELAESFGNEDHADVLSLYVKTQLVALVKKYPFTESEVQGFDPERAAWKKFLAAEHLCKRINQRQAALRNGDGFEHAEVLQYARKYIRRVLGASPDLAEVYRRCDFGPGASVGVSGDFTNIARKLLARRWTCGRLALSNATEALWQHKQIRDWILTEPGRDIVCYDREKFSQLVAARVDLVSHNNISFVPKTFKTKRSIASEPLLNGYLQKGIDAYMRELLARHARIDLRNQADNSELARIGSLGGMNPYCTIDLTSASDSMSTSIVKLLLPEEWFDLLDRTRSHCYRYQGAQYEYQKFVSMGNGFCFPLQTLIFASLAYGCLAALHGPKCIPEVFDFRVYGDDIIVRRSVAAYLLEVLKYCGFRNNPDKTFIFGPFRESCGTDWYRGLDVRPVYLDFRLESNSDLYKFHNSWLRSELTAGLSAELRPWLRDMCPPEVRFVRPYHGSADSAFTVEKDVAMSSPHVRWDRTTWAWSWKEVLRTSVRDKLHGFDPDVCNVMEYLAVLRGSSSRTPLAVRRKTRAQIRRVSYWALPGEMTWVGAEQYRGRKAPEL